MTSKVSRNNNFDRARPGRVPGVSTDAIRSGIFYEIIACFVIAATAALIYSNSIGSPFVFDDTTNILENPHIRLQTFSVEKIASGLAHSGNRPLATFSFMLNYLFGGYHPFGYHLVNILIHALSGIIFFVLVKITLRLSDDGHTATTPLPISLTALLAALLWIVHPVNTQSVTYIVQRMNSLSTMFCLLALVLYVRARPSAGLKKSGLIVLAALSWILALASKENAITLPILVLLYDWYFFQNLNMRWQSRYIKYGIAALIVIGSMALVFLGPDPLEKMQSLKDFTEGQFSYTERILTQFRVIIHYLSLFFFPHPSRLNLDYDFALSHSVLSPPTTIIAIVAILGIFLLGAMTAKKWRVLSFCIIWFFVNLAVESSIIPIAIIFEHRTYMPFMGMALLVIIVIDRYVKFNWLKVALACFFIVCGAWWTYERNVIWKDSFTLWQDVVTKSPMKARPHFNLGIAYADMENDRKAMDHYEIAIELDPDYAEVYNNIAYLHFKKGRWEAAERVARLALEKKPDSAKAHNTLGAALLEQGKDDEALQHFSQALDYNPGFAEAYMNIGVIYAQRDKKETALKYFRYALEFSPDLPGAHNKIGDLYSRENDLRKAAYHFEEALEIDPRNSEALTNIGMLNHKQGNTTQAMAYYRKALSANAENPDAHYNIANLYRASGNTLEAERHYRDALKIDDEHVGAHTNLGTLLSEKNDAAQALKHYKKAIELNPEYADAHNNIGNILSTEQRFESAIPYYREAIRINPDFDDAHANLGIALMRMGDIEGAQHQFRLALEINPINQNALNGLDLIASSAGTPQPTASPETLHKKALEHAARGEYDLAVEFFKQILEIVPAEPGTCYNIACMYAQMGKIKESIEWLTLAIQNGYDNWEAIKHDPDLENIRETDAFNTLIKDH